MLNDRNIVKIIAVGPLVFIPLIVIIISILVAKSNSDSFEKNIQKLELELISAERIAIKTRVDGVVNHVAYRKSIIKKNLNQRVKKRVNNAYKIANNIYEKYKGKKSDEEIKKIIISALRPLTWNDGESFVWILDFKGVFYLAPEYLRHLENSSVIDFKDATGKFVIKEEIAICKEKKEGFLWDTFTKPNEDPVKQFKQVAFVKAFGHYDWYLGSGEYLDRAQKMTDAYLLESLKKMYELGSNYIFVGNRDGDILLNRVIPEFVGKNVHDINNSALLAIHEQTKKLLDKKDSGYIKYVWINQTTKEEDIKHTYVHKIPNGDWIIASGYLESSIKNKVAKKSVELYKLHKIEVKNLLILSTLLIFISLILSYIISRYIKKSFTAYQAKINNKSVELQKLNETLDYRVKARTKELEELTQKLEVLATTDSLTRIHNRYSIMNILSLEIHRSVRSKQPLSIIMYDIDYFKNVNDEYGHDVGDKVLVELTNVVKSSLREIDFIGRYGGEEFLIIMPTTTLESAKEIATRVREEVQNHSFEVGVEITISLGLVESVENEDTNAIFKRLDNLLYDSKNSGRNRLSF